jgi:exonuclease SbcC
MIPQRVLLEGFLCYKDEQEVAFDGAKLWMLAGLNGSGKSSVFDAVTYALFGHHRGGTINAGDLINKESDKALIELEFTLGTERYLAKRTIQRTRSGATKATQQVFAILPNGQQQPIEDTQSKTGYDKWMSQHVGLSYDVFTSSVLLLQGKAEKLLDAGPKGRHEVLAGIVDLERYERLHRRAYEEAKGIEISVKNFKSRLETTPEVTPLELADAAAQIETAEAAQQQAMGEVERLQQLREQASKWTDVQARLTVARQRWEQARKLVADSEAIEKDLKRLHELHDVLPRLQTVVEQRGEIQKSEQTTQELTQRKRQQEEALATQDDALNQARQKRESLRALIADNEQKHQSTTAALRKSDALLGKLTEYERHEHDLQAIRRDLARMPPDPAASLKKARDAYDEAAALAQSLPLLVRFHSQRDQLGKARERLRLALEAVNTIKARGKQCRAESDEHKLKLAAARKSRQDADAAVTTARTLLTQARNQLDELQRLDGAKTCRHCGQELTEKHLHDEKGRRQRDVKTAETALQHAEQAQRQAVQEEQAADKLGEELEKRLNETIASYREQERESAQAQRDVDRLQRECRQTWSELSESFRQRIAAAPPGDWCETAYPSEPELRTLRQQAGDLQNARRKLDDADKAFVEWNTFKGQETAARANLQRLESELPADRQQIRGEHARLQVEEKAIHDDLAAQRQQADAAQKDLDRLTKEGGQIERQLADLDGKLATEEARKQHCRHTVSRALAELPPAWQQSAERAGTGELFRWRSEHDGLVEKQTEERGRLLQQARVGLDVMQHDLGALEEEERAFPPETRQEPEHVAGLLRSAQQAAHQRNEELNDAKQRRKALDEQRRQREELHRAYLQAEKELKDAETLAKLLGRDRLQLHLVRQAERQVVDHANAVLDRISGGQLYLRLVGEAGGDGGGEKALELEAHNRVTGERPINVAFLSGSQKFRVAVSLALGLGQYASRQHRPIESVIIDEGFGCLDKDGRQAMIQELQNLRGHLRCILLVSHQEEFAEAFADGYRFELANGTTKVTRFQR